jgi:hypothetical protein
LINCSRGNVFATTVFAARWDAPSRSDKQLRVNRVTAVKKAPFFGAFASTNHCVFLEQYTGPYAAVKRKLFQDLDGFLSGTDP